MGNKEAAHLIRQTHLCTIFTETQDKNILEMAWLVKDKSIGLFFFKSRYDKLDQMFLKIIV
jgi:hypothetical protein